jgi:hypothetical protein
MPSDHRGNAVAAVGRLRTTVQTLEAGAVRTQLEADLATLIAELAAAGYTIRGGYEIPAA